MGDNNIITVSIDDSQRGQRFDRALTDAAGDLSRERVKALMASGAIRREDGLALPNASAKVEAAMTLTITLPLPVDAAARPQAIALDIYYEDDALIVVNKQAGLVVHPANGHGDGTLVNALLHHCAGQLSGIGGVARPGIVHRIDKDTTGLIVVAKNDAAHIGLARQFADHSIERTYHAIVAGVPVPPAGRIETWLARSPQNRQKIAVAPAGSGKLAITHFRMLQRLDRAALVECRLETGRTHQVRVHMAHRGHPLLGDPFYGRQGPHSARLRQMGFHRQALHAIHLGFIHPISGKKLAFDSACPDDMQRLFTSLAL